MNEWYFFYIYQMIRKLLIVLSLITLLVQPAVAWSPQGHILVALIARSQLSSEVISNVNFYLKGMTWEEAACWMDDRVLNPKAEETKTWCFALVDKDKTYVQSKEPNLINKLEFCIRILQYRTLQSDESIHENLKLLFHLLGEIHQPLHCGYVSDRGGEEIDLYLIQKETNLFRLWDKEIIKEKKMDIWYLAKSLVGLNMSVKRKADIEKLDVMHWMQESRLLLPEIYKINGGKVDQLYVDMNAPRVEMQLIKAGLRLAALLNKYFK